MIRKEFTSTDLAVALKEASGIVAESRVNNIYQIDGKTIIFKLHKTGQSPIRLVVEAGLRLHLSAYSIEPPSIPPAFCMALRKYLRNAWLSEVSQHEFERIAIFNFKTKTSIMQLVIELFGDGNIILIDQENKILQALIFRRMRDRNILRGEIFQFPPSIGKNPYKITREDFENNLKDSIFILG